MRNSELAEESQMWFRVGINVGDVMIDGDDLFGDGVNIAARLEGLAQRGGICISGSTFDQVKRKLSIAFDDIGGQEVKNIPEPVQAFRIVPGKVAVSEDSPSVAATHSPARAGMQTGLFVACAATVLLVAAYFAGSLQINRSVEHPYDGRWKVTVSSLNGCLDNSDKNYFVVITNSKIDEARQPLPKSGEINSDGEATIRVTDQSGNPRNTQYIKISDDIGDGRFQGKRPGCTGKVSMMRID